MKKWLKHLFVASIHNNFKPRLLTESAAFAIIALFIGILVSVQSGGVLVFKKDSLLSEVYPTVVANFTNQGRQASNLSPLAYNKTLEAAAQQKVNDMISRSYFAHTSPGGKQPWDWIRDAGYPYEYAGENLAINFSDSIDVYNAWMNSPSHKANILNSNFTEVGIAVAKTTVNGKDSILVVEMFGSPKYGSNKGSNTQVAVTQNTQTTPTPPTNPVAEARPPVSSPTSTLAPSTTIPSNIQVAIAQNPNSNPVSTNPSQVANQTASGTSVLGASVPSDYSISTTTSPMGSGTTNGGSQNQFENQGANINSGNYENENPSIASDSGAFIGGMTTSPRTVTLVLYSFFILILNIAVISFGFIDYHKHHKKSIFIAVFMVFCLTLLSFVYIKLNPAMVLL